ncbi:MAG: hypothetical protein H3C63_18760, partial [Candidatus Omnitrophica bacterium]|nr:hypothetical protein [Candidatus Omnitrophota bacterium]
MIVDVYPKPITEYCEESAPGQMTILSFPKYYRDSLQRLQPVDTTVVQSKDSEWDFEVTTGIWSLFARKDGTFQARHRGDVFTYRFESLGIGRGSGYQPLDLGQADFSRLAVAGDRLTWQNVVEGVDLQVRYIHDILKVDVVVKKEIRNRIRTSVQRGELPSATVLTARFSIPSVLITSQAKQGKEDADLYAERLDVSARPLHFEKNGKTIHTLRPVETSILDANGQPIEFIDNDPKPGNEVVIRSAQAWQLQPNQPGFAEMSAFLEDILQAPEGDVAIDPSIIFSGDSNVIDTYLSSTNQSSNYSSSQNLYLRSVNNVEY